MHENAVSIPGLECGVDVDDDADAGYLGFDQLERQRRLPFREQPLGFVKYGDGPLKGVAWPQGIYTWRTYGRWITTATTCSFPSKTSSSSPFTSSAISETRLMFKGSLRTTFMT
jgi:hypothetical protein